MIEVPLSVLDLSPVAAGTTAGQALLRAGAPQALAGAAEAAAYPYTPLERHIVAERLAGQAIGSPDTVGRQLASLIERTGADELMLTALVYDIEDRIRSLELIAEKVTAGLRPAGPAD